MLLDFQNLFFNLKLLDVFKAVSLMQAITISANAWSNAGHAINLIYDLLHMMGRDDIRVGVGGEGGISYAGNFSSNVGGYFPLIEQVSNNTTCKLYIET